MTKSGITPEAPLPRHGQTAWIYDERRRIRDDVAARLVALPFIDRVEVVSDIQSLLVRLATRQPDVLLVIAQKALDTGLTAAAQVLRAHPGVPVLVLGAPDDADSVRTAVSCGARGYLRWDATPLELGLGISRFGIRADGRSPQQANMHGTSFGASPLVGSQTAMVRSTVRELAPINLALREMQVLAGMSQGKSNAQIGRELYISEDTVKTHARRLFRKLDAKDRAQAVAAGFRLGLIS